MLIFLSRRSVDGVAVGRDSWIPVGVRIVVLSVRVVSNVPLFLHLQGKPDALDGVIRSCPPIIFQRIYTTIIISGCRREWNRIAPQLRSTPFHILAKNPDYIIGFLGPTTPSIFHPTEDWGKRCIGSDP